MSTWFEVDKAGLAALTARRDKAFLLSELLANAWDAPGVTRVEVTATPAAGRPEVVLRVVDDAPAGFTDLTHAFTLFAPTAKRAQAEQRGRFNLGEKLSLAIARSASITSTTGTVVFDPKAGRRRSAKPRTERGSVVAMTVPMTRSELDGILAEARTFIAPVPTVLNGEPIPARIALASFEVRLPTELAAEDGTMRRTERTCRVDVYTPIGEARLYELGIPVCTTGDTFDVDIRQKVPLSLERESVTDAYLRRVRAAVLAHCSHLLDEAASRAAWVTAALEARDLPPDAVATVVRRRFGEKAVVFDPSDPEANKRAVQQGYQVIHGGSFSAGAWASIRDAGVLKPAGQVTPTARPWAEDGQPAVPVVMTDDMRRYSAWCQRLARCLLGTDIAVEFYPRFNDFNVRAAYAPGRLQFAVNRLGHAFFAGPIAERHIDLLLHEFGHHYEGDHLSRRYHDALTMLGAKLAMHASVQPSLLDLDACDSSPAHLAARA